MRLKRKKRQFYPKMSQFYPEFSPVFKNDAIQKSPKNAKKRKKRLENMVFSSQIWRKRWDSNPRAREDYLISS